MIKKRESAVTVHVTGDTTGDPFHGVFAFKVTQSQSDRFREDALRREYIGPCPAGMAPSPETQAGAEMLAAINVRLMPTPPNWWINSRNGLDLEDSNILISVYNKIMEEVLDAMNLRQKEAETAKTEIKQHAETITKTE